MHFDLALGIEQTELQDDRPRVEPWRFIEAFVDAAALASIRTCAKCGQAGGPAEIDGLPIPLCAACCKAFSASRST